MQHLPIILLLIAGQAWMCVSDNTTWDCSNYYKNTTVKYARSSLCYKPTEEPLSLEGQDPLLMNTMSSTTVAEKKLFCAKAAIGRGYQQFFLKGGACTIFKNWHAEKCYGKEGGGCHERSSSGFPCRAISNMCYCGTKDDLGGSNYYNVYSIIADDWGFSFGLWIEVEDVFNNTVEMFNKTSPKYIHLYENYKSAIEKYLKDSKIICGIYRVVFNSFIFGTRPKNGPGPILMNFQLTGYFINLTVLHEKFKQSPHQISNVTEFSIRNIRGHCSTEAKILGLSFRETSSFTHPKRKKRTGFKFFYDISSSCVTPLLTKTHVKLANISKDGYISTFTTLCSTELVNRTLSRKSCKVSPRSQDEGLYYVIGEAWTPEHPAMLGFDELFINIIKGDLIAHVTKAKDCIHVLGIQTYLNGSGSYDSNIFSSAVEAVSYTNDLKYTWVCYKSTGIIDPNTARSLPIVESGVTISGKSGGCFNSGPGRLNTTIRGTYFVSSTLSVGETVNFMMLVEKDNRYAYATKSCLVVPAPSKYVVRCVFNCGLLMKTTARLGLRPFCDDPAGCSRRLTHSWKFLVDTGRKIYNGDGTFERIWKPYNATKRLTETTNIYNVVDKLSFEQNKTYRVQHVVNNAAKGVRVTNYDFTTNTFPHSGTCEADKTTIEAGIDVVNITCRDWVDEQPLLSYEAWVLPHNTQPRLVYFGNSSSFILRLPLGDSANDFTLKIKIKIFDIYESTRFFINLKVTEPTDAPFNAILGGEENGDRYEQERAQRSIASLSLLGNSYASNITMSNKAKIRSSIISKITNISANNTQSITLVTGVLIDATSKNDELSLEGQMQSINAAFSLSETLQSDNSTDDPEVFEDVGTTLLHLTGNVLDGAAANNASKSNISHAKALGETALNTSNTISSMLLGKMMGGEISKKFVTPFLGLDISKTKSNKLPKTYEINGGVVDVPPVMTALIGNITECQNETCSAADTFVSTKMLYSNSNPYTWSNDSIDVKSSVVSLDYLTNSGDTIAVGGIDSDFKITIPTKPPQKPNTTTEHPYFVTPNTDCAMHKFYISNDDTAFETIISLEQEVFVTVFLRYNQRPTEEEYDYVFHHPNVSSCVESKERDNCTGVVDFTECMGLNRTLWEMNDERCDNISLPDIGFLSNTGNANSPSNANNTSYSRDQMETCIDYHNVLTCPLECTLNSSGNSSSLNSSQIAVAHGNHSGLCGNMTRRNLTSGNNLSSVCQKVKDFLYCKNTSLEKYEECKGLLIKKNFIYGKYEKCSENINRTFFGLDLFRQAGWYYASICYPARQKNITNILKPTTPAIPTTKVDKDDKDNNGQSKSTNSSKLESGDNTNNSQANNTTTTTPTYTTPTTTSSANATNSTTTSTNSTTSSPTTYTRRLRKKKKVPKKRSVTIDQLDWTKDDIMNSYDGNEVAILGNSAKMRESDDDEKITLQDAKMIGGEMDSTSKPSRDKHSYDSDIIESRSDADNNFDEGTKQQMPLVKNKISDKKEKELSINKDRESEDYDSFLDSEKEGFYSDDNNFEMDTHERVLIRSRRETTERKCAVVNIKPAPTIPPNHPLPLPRVKPQVFNVSSSLNYSFDINLFTCLFWNTTIESWSTNGCKPHRNSTPTSLVCICNHLTSFGADSLVAPNPIDFDEVFANFAKLGETGNFSVLFTVIGLFLLYALSVVLARRADRRDVLLVSKTRVGSIDVSRGSYNYEITVSTGTFRGSGTTANAALVMVGENGTSQTIPLVDETGRSEDILSRGNVAYLIVNTPEHIGDITYIRIWHNNQGEDPAWFMRQITIRDLMSNKKWVYLHNDWFAVDRSDGKIDRRIYAASESEKSKFKTLFYSHTAKSFSDKHLWISVILRPPSNPFTRVQRVTCCFSLLFCAMLGNAMFYQNGESSEDTFQVGPFKLSLRQIIVGIESGLIVAPINLLIITLFRKARRKTQNKTNYTPKKDSLPENQKTNIKLSEESNIGVAEKKKTSKVEAKKKGLPHWCSYLAYFLSAISVLISAAFVTFYSIMWGTEKSNEWMTSVALSLIQDILLLQPLKVIVLAMILSAIFRRPPEEDVEDEPSTEQKKQQQQQLLKDDSVSSNDIALNDIDPEQYEPLDSEDVDQRRDYQNKKNTMRSLIKKIVWHFLFVLLLSATVFGTQSSHRYRLQDHVEKVFYKTEKVKTSDSFWWWCETVLLPGLYVNDWYNGGNFTDEREGFISNKKAFLIGMPRMRQVRVKAEQCTATKDYPRLHDMFPNCYSDYSMWADESPPSMSTLRPPLFLNDSILNGEIGQERMCLQPFMFQSAKKLGTLPVFTDDATYSGSGMVADLGYDNSTASEVVLNLKADKWITRQTRVVFVEFVVFEPTSRLYAFAQFSFEQKSTGSIFSSKSIGPYALYGTGQASFDYLILVIQILLMIFILVCLVKEVIKMIKLRITYFKDPWNIHELVMVGFSIGLVVLGFVRDIYVRSIIKAIQENPYSRMSFDYVKYGTEVWNTMASLVVFLATLKLLGLLVFNKKILTFTQVLKLSRPFLVSYALFFFIVFFAFAQCGNLIFGQRLLMYSNVLRSFVNVFQMALGKGLFFHDLKDVATTLGPAYILCYFMVTTLLLVNFFVSILNESYADGSKKIEEETNEDAIMAAFMSAYVRSFLKEISKDLKEMQTKGRKRRRQVKNQKGATDESKETNLEKEASLFLY